MFTITYNVGNAAEAAILKFAQASGFTGTAEQYLKSRLDDVVDRMKQDVTEKTMATRREALKAATPAQIAAVDQALGITP